jgi:hypothetical protein
MLGMTGEADELPARSSAEGVVSWVNWFEGRGERT